MFRKKKEATTESDGLFEQDIFVAPARSKKEIKKSQKEQEEAIPLFQREEEPVRKKPEPQPRRQHKPIYQPVYTPDEDLDYDDDAVEEEIPRYQEPKRKESPTPLYQKKPEPEPWHAEDKADIGEYFQPAKKSASKLKKKTREPRVDESKMSKKERKRQLEMDLYEGRAFRYKDQIFRDVEQFIEYITIHYLHIDKIAKEIFENEQFFSWLKKHSDQFDGSLIVFEEIQQKIGNK